MYTNLKQHAGIFYITPLEQITTHEKVLVYGIIEDAYDTKMYRYDTIADVLMLKYDDYICKYLSLSYIPIHYYSESCVPSILSIIKSLCLHNGLEHVYKNMFKTDDELLYMLCIQQALKLFGLNDLRTYAQICKYIMSQYVKNNDQFNARIDPEVFNIKLKMYEEFVTAYDKQADYILNLMIDIQNYVNYQSSTVIQGFNPYTKITHCKNKYHTATYNYKSLIDEITIEIKGLLGKY